MTDIALATKPNLYDKDFYAWTNEQAHLLKNRQFNRIDIKNLREEILSLRIHEELELTMNTRLILRYIVQFNLEIGVEERERLYAVREGRRTLERILRLSPSLFEQGSKSLEQCYADARKQAAIESGKPVAAFPEDCPFTFEQVIDESFFPLPLPKAGRELHSRPGRFTIRATANLPVGGATPDRPVVRPVCQTGLALNIFPGIFPYSFEQVLQDEYLPHAIGGNKPNNDA